MGRLCPQSLRQVWLDEAWYARFEEASVEQLDESRPYQYAAGRRWL
jgi:hypothetical protein